MKSRKKSFFILTIKSLVEINFLRFEGKMVLKGAEEGSQEFSGRMNKLLARSVRLAAFSITYCPSKLGFVAFKKRVEP
jgi:hypothetical protein